MTEGHLFFAEDVFGSQISIRRGAIWSFDTETGKTSIMADSIEGWAVVLLADADALTGAPLARQWRGAHGHIDDRSRLVPKTLFVLGGDFAISNLHKQPADEGMRFSSSIAVHLRDLPDGAQVELVVKA